MADDNNSTQVKEEAARSILSLMSLLDIPQTQTFKIDEFEKQLIGISNQTVQNVPKLLFTFPLVEAEWAKMDNYIHALNVDYAKRVDLLKKRLEVTVDSFLWSERVQKLETQIKEICDRSQFKEAEFQPVEVDQLLAANSDLLMVTKTSSEQFRQKTKVKEVCDFKMRTDVIPDRGGRTEQMTPIQRESFSFQQQNRQKRQQGGFQHNRGGGGNFQQDGSQGRGGDSSEFYRGGGGQRNQRGKRRLN